jgi:hypothetical protein
MLLRSHESFGLVNVIVRALLVLSPVFTPFACTKGEVLIGHMLEQGEVNVNPNDITGTHLQLSKNSQIYTGQWNYVTNNRPINFKAFTP